LNERHTSFWKFVPESAATVAAGYAIQAVDAFNKTAFVVEIGIVIFCFAAASLPLPLFIVLGAVLGALTLRDAYTHPHRGSDVREKQRPGSQYYVDMAGDAVTAAVFLFASQALMLEVSPSLAVPGRAFFARRFGLPSVVIDLPHAFAAPARSNDPVERLEYVRRSDL